MADSKVTIDVEAEVSEAKRQLADLTARVDEMAERSEGAGERGSRALDLLGGAARAVAGAAVAAGAAAGAAVAGIGSAALGAYASYEQLVGGVDTLFGSASQKLQGYAADAYRTAGMSANQYMEQATGFSAALVQGLKADGRSMEEVYSMAADSANTAMTDMADNVNKMGSSMADVQNAYQGFAKDNYTMLDNLKLGYGGTQSEMARLINDSGVLGDTVVDANTVTSVSFDKIIEAIHVTQERMGIMGTTAEEAMGTIEGSVNMARGAWENWLVGLANPDADMGALTEQLLASLGAVADNVLPVAERIGSTILDALPGALSGAAERLAPVLSEALAAAWNLAAQALAGLGIDLPEVDASQVQGALEAVGDAFAQLGRAVAPVIQAVFPLVQQFAQFVADNWPLIAPVVAGVVAAFLAFAAVQGVIGVVTALGAALAFLASPIGIVVVAVGAVVAAIVALATNAGGCRDMVVGAFSSVVSFVSGLPGAIGGFLASVVSSVLAWAASMVSNALQTGASFLSNVVSFLSQLPGRVVAFLSYVISGVVGWAGQMASNAASAGSQFLGNVVSFVSSVPGRVAGLLGDVIGRVGSWVGEMASGAANAAHDFGQSLMDGISSLPERVGEIGRNIVDGIANGIRNAAGSVADALWGAAGGALDWVKGQLGIASPSKVMRDQVGRWIPLGVSEGIEDEASAVQGALDSALSLDPTVSLERSVSLSAVPARAAQVTQNITFEQPVQTPDEMAREMRMWSMYGLGATS